MVSHRLPDIHYQGPNLDVAEPPDDLPYAQFWDYYNREVLRLNGMALEPNALIDVLASPESDPILRAAAAHTAGADGAGTAVPALREALGGTEDLITVEAAYALTRLGHEEGKAALVAVVGRPTEAELGPLFAAGYLAQLGDPRGFPGVVRALDGDAPAARMLACKQLHFFMPFHGRREPDGDVTDVVGAFERALAHPDSALHWQALFQLRETSDFAFVELVRRYAVRAPDAALATMALSILDRIR
jgi:HEAT repeat protein